MIANPNFRIEIVVMVLDETINYLTLSQYENKNFLIHSSVEPNMFVVKFGKALLKSFMGRSG